MPKERDISWDFLKGIGILAIIIGHYGIAVDFVFSFHVPLFFIVAGCLFHQRGVRYELKNDAKRLLIPYAVTSLFILIWDMCVAIKQQNPSKIYERIIEILIGGGSPRTYWLLGNIGQIGAIWFLWALFVCKNIYNLLDRWLKGYWCSAVCLLLSIGATWVYNHITAVPLDILQGLSALIFYDLGRRLKDIGGFKKVSIGVGLIGIIIWIIAIRLSFMSICTCRYDCYPLDVIGALGATWTIWYCGDKIIKKSERLASPIVWIGQNSLGLLCLHLIDLETGILHKLQHWTIDWHYHNNYIHAMLVILISCGLIHVWNKEKIKIKNRIICKNS